MRKRPFLAIGIASFFAAWIGSNISATAVYIVSAILTVMMGISVLGYRTPWMKQIGVLCGAAMMVLMMLACKNGMIVRQHEAYADTQATVTARVTGVRQDGTRLEVRVEHGDLRQGTRLLLWSDESGIDWREGDLVSGQCRVVAAFDATRPQDGRMAKANGTYLYAWPLEDTTLVWHDGQATLGVCRRGLIRVRQWISDTLETHTTFAAPLCKAMMMGDRKDLSDKVSEAFRACGIYHVLAVSGLHVSVLIGALVWLLKAMRCPRRRRAVIIMIALLLFMALCGFSPSVMRAGVMALLALASTLFRRRADGLNSLGMAATAMLLLDPFTIYDVGWQLSFAATMGLLCMGPVWQREVTERLDRLPIWMEAVAKPVSTSVGVTVCAAVVTVPITACAYGEISVITLVCNVLLVPLTAILLVISFIGLGIEAVAPWLASAYFDIVEWLARGIGSMAQAFASWPHSMVWGGDAAQVLWLCCLPLFLVAAYRWFGVRGVGRALALMSVSAVLVACGSQLVWRAPTEVRVADHEYPTFLVCTTDGIGAVVSGDESSVTAVQQLLLEAGERRMDWILWIDTIPSVHVENAKALQTERLIVSRDPSSYASLPQATETYVLEAGDTVSLTASLRLTERTGVYRLENEDMTLLTTALDALCSEDARTYLRADAAILFASLPKRSDLIDAEEWVVCGEEYDVYRAWYTLSQEAKERRLRSPQTEESVRLSFR